MDRKTILIVVGCLVAWFGAQQVIDHLYPPIPKKAKPLVAPATNTLAKPLPEQIQPVAAAPKPSVAEELVAISNEFVRIEFTNIGGGVRTVELLKHKANGHGHTVLNGPTVAPALSLLGIPGAGSNDLFTLERRDATTVVARNAAVTKTFTLDRDYLVRAQFVLATPTPSSARILVGTAAPANSKEITTYLNADWQGGPKFNNRDLSRVAKRTKNNENREPMSAHWVAVKSQYFVQVVSLETNATSVTYHPVPLPSWADSTVKIPPQGVAAEIEFPLHKPIFSFTYYAGPKEYDRLLALGKNQEEAMDFGSWMDFYSGIFGLILLRGLMLFHGLIPSYGIAICLVTIALKVIFWPIQAKSMASMKAMQKFQPHLQKLKEKYKDDPQRLNMETMQLYKEHKINPFAGCLPMLVQLPVLIAFYKVLVSDIALRGVPFLWIHDLSLPDTVFTIAGFGINPLPLVMVGSMIWQQKITPTTGDPQQAKMMMFMPLIMLMFFYNTAAGLTLYWTLQQLLSVLQQWWSLRKDKQAGLVPAAAKTK